MNDGSTTSARPKSRLSVMAFGTATQVSPAALAEVTPWGVSSKAMVKLGDEDQVGPIRAALYPSQSDELEATASLRPWSFAVSR